MTDIDRTGTNTQENRKAYWKRLPPLFEKAHEDDTLLEKALERHGTSPR